MNAGDLGCATRSNHASALVHASIMHAELPAAVAGHLAGERDGGGARSGHLLPPQGRGARVRAAAYRRHQPRSRRWLRTGPPRSTLPLWSTARCSSSTSSARTARGVPGPTWYAAGTPCPPGTWCAAHLVSPIRLDLAFGQIKAPSEGRVPLVPPCHGGALRESRPRLPPQELHARVRDLPCMPAVHRALTTGCLLHLRSENESLL